MLLSWTSQKKLDLLDKDWPCSKVETHESLKGRKVSIKQHLTNSRSNKKKRPTKKEQPPPNWAEAFRNLALGSQDILADLRDRMQTKGTNREKNPKSFCQNMNRFFDEY